METGIYKIQNIKNLKLYIGSTRASFRKRFTSHKNELRRNSHGNNFLQNSWNKYGEESFVFIPLYRCDKKDCLDFERFFIDFYNPEYNLARVSKNLNGFICSEEQKEKLRLARSKPFFLISPLGKFYEGTNLKSFSEELNLSYSALNKVNLGKAFHHYGWTNSVKNYLLYKNLGSKASPASREYKEICLINEKLEKFKVYNLKEFCLKNELSKSSLLAVISEKERSCKGFYLDNESNRDLIKSLNSYFPIELVNRTTKEKVVFKNRQDISLFCKANDMKKTSDIWKVIKNTLKSCKGWSLS